MNRTEIATAIQSKVRIFIPSALVDFVGTDEIMVTVIGKRAANQVKKLMGNVFALNLAYEDNEDGVYLVSYKF